MVLWEFGYGSIIWNPGFDFDEKLIGNIKDYKRVFDLGPEKEKLAIEYLERRECEYDSKTLVEFYTETDTSEPILTGVIVFTSTPDKVSNKYYFWRRWPCKSPQLLNLVGTTGSTFSTGRKQSVHDIEHQEEFVIELANEVRNTAKLAKGSEGIVETCGFSCTHPSKLSLKLNFHISYPHKQLISN
uniref:Uncharacterized protein n=1 Tax=Brassica campestris TaxID=3711 RepID=M4D091_BRACM